METVKNLQTILAFVQVAGLKSFSAAAKELGVSKAFVSKQVQKLEDELGQRLLNRSTRMVELTHAGGKFYEACSASLYNISKAQEEILQNADSPHGKLKISLAGAFGEDYIAPFLASFIKKYPRIQVELHFEEKLVDLVKESYDIAIRVGTLKDSSLIARKIAIRKEYICATPSYLNLHGIPKTPEDLKAHNCITPKDNWNLFLNEKLVPFRVNSNFKSNNGRSMMKATLADLGICMLPGVYVRPYIESGQLTSLLESFTPKEVPIWALTPSRKNMPLSVKAFLEEVASQFDAKTF